MMIRLIMEWDIQIGHEQEFSEYAIREFAPGIMDMGIEPNDVLYTIYGDEPQMMAICSIANYDKMTEIMTSDRWQELHNGLLQYVTNYNHRIVYDNGKNFQI
ncbi:MAG: hypothetical protein AAF639_23070 [Chloroflexota bacterium]